eukprot:scaffold19228_cov90-Phaeocystis_antarctica.AAC.2
MAGAEVVVGVGVGVGAAPSTGVSVPQALVSRLARASRILPAVTGLRHVSKEGSLAHRARSLTVSTSWASSSSSSRPMWFGLISADASNQFR